MIRDYLGLLEDADAHPGEPWTLEEGAVSCSGPALYPRSTRPIGCVIRQN